MVTKTTQLQYNLPIVDSAGRPTAQFIQVWNQISKGGSGGAITAAQISAALDLLGHTEGDMLRRGPSGWLTISSPGGTALFLRADGTWAAAGATALASMSDVSIPAPNNGDVLTYVQAAAKWESLPAGTVPGHTSTQWRILVHTVNSGPVFSLGELQMFETLAGGNVALASNGGVASVSSTQFGSPSMINDGILAQNWGANGIAGEWAEITFPTAKAITIIGIASNADPTQSARMAPATWDVQYWNGAAWITEWSVNSTGVWTLPLTGELHTFAKPLPDKAAVTVVTHTADYALQAGDSNSYQRMVSASPLLLTVPPDSSVLFPIGTVIRGSQEGAGKLSVGGGAGVTMNFGPAPASPYGKGDGFELIKVDNNIWDVLGRANISLTWTIQIGPASSAGNDPGYTGYTNRNCIPLAHYATTIGPNTRIHIPAGSAGLQIGECWAGASSGGSEHVFNAAPVQVTFGGSTTASAAAGVDIVSDAFPTPTGGVNLLVSMYIVGPNGDFNIYPNAGVIGKGYYHGNVASALSMPSVSGLAGTINISEVETA